MSQGNRLLPKQALRRSELQRERGAGRGNAARIGSAELRPRGGLARGEARQRNCENEERAHGRIVPREPVSRSRQKRRPALRCESGPLREETPDSRKSEVL